MLVDYAYPRALGSAQYPKGVWNGNTYLPAQQPDYAAVCGYVETANPKRDDICAYEPFASSSISSSTSVPSPSQPLRKYTSSTTSTSIKQSPTPSSTNQGIYTDATFSNSSIFVSLNQTAMITSLGKILSDICPPYAQQNHCSNQTMVISDVYSSIDGTMYRGEVNVWVDDSSYTSEARRSSMLILDSTTMAQAASRCTNVTWSLGNCAEEETTIVGREVGGDLPCIAQPPIYMCSYPSNVLVMTFEENNPNHWDYIVSFSRAQFDADLKRLIHENDRTYLSNSRPKKIKRAFAQSLARHCNLTKQ